MVLGWLGCDYAARLFRIAIDLGIFVPEISARLKEEREALGLSQQALADACGISARSQRNYESGERLPDAAYLAAIAALGADVLFVLTGQRSRPASASAELRPDQAALLDNYEHSDEVARQAAQRLLDPRAQRKKA